VTSAADKAEQVDEPIGLVRVERDHRRHARAIEDLRDLRPHDGPPVVHRDQPCRAREPIRPEPGIDDELAVGELGGAVGDGHATSLGVQ
jgi:hypothetical protein